MSNDCFLDLQRVATALYLNPKGKTHLIFLEHARKILEEQGIERFNADLDCVEKMLRRCRGGVAAKKVADKILTLGLLIKGSPCSSFTKMFDRANL